MKHLLLMLALAWPVLAFAHKPSDAYLQLQVEGAQVDARFDIALRDLDRELVLDANDDGQLDWREVRTRWAEIEALAQQALSLQADEHRCQVIPAAATPQLDEHSDGRYAVLTQRWQCEQPVHRLSIGYRLFERSDPTHRGIVRVRQGTRDDSGVLVPGAAPRSFALSNDGTPERPLGFAGFVAEGMHHILIGADHVLFLLALLLPAVLVRREGHGWEAAPALRPVLAEVMRVVTAFTVAHSITLGLAAFDVLNPPSRWIESLIAASVIFAALNNLWPVLREGRWVMTFAFGLVHGFGFAGPLKDLGLAQGALAWPLLGFNLGVELGQLLVVTLFVGLVWRLRTRPLYTTWMLRLGSAVIAPIALAWLVQRAFDLQLA